ncbi:MAG TPA: protein kinase [Marinagarivorans sp.]
MAGKHAFSDSLFSSPEFAAKYEINSLLGQGGFGAVYKATQLSTGQDVAIKVMKPGSEGDNHNVIERFRREMQLCAKFSHPNIVRLIDSGHEQDDRMFTVFEFVPGHTLHKLPCEQRRLCATQAKDLMLQVLDALACAHDHGVLHRDLKPDNIMISQTHRGFHVKLLDFGISTLFGEAAADLSRITATKGFVGTYAYTSPEHLHGKALTPASDLYSWGLIFLECLQGRRVMAGETIAKLFFEQMSDQPVPIPAWLQAHSLGDLISEVLKKNPSERLHNAAEIAQRLVNIDVTDLRAPQHLEADNPTVMASGHPSSNATPSSDNHRSFSTPPSASQHSARAPSHTSQTHGGNRSGQYSRPEDWSDLASVQADLARLRQQQSLQTRRRDAMSALVLRLRKKRGGQFNDSLRDITSSAAEILDSARVSIWTISEDKQSIRCLDLFERQFNTHSSGGILEAKHYPSYFEALNAELAIAADDVFYHSATRELLDYCSSLGISSMLDAPIWVGGRMYGVLCHEHVGTMRSWTEDEFSLAASLADTASLALAAHQRSQLENALTGVKFD